ncbi:hypothetical protein RHMOL_Rhmol07G0244300 [Rhododendron molle]|uniref:Uncharacterized protein n=1 Tax=Rhododendron molle TaxID=49168 RepID=A0ACC0N5B2_RHOML|nr:hypothetical protein RHMOL_Rhmol07G0244300 [Rhododendron molle]
MNAMKDKSTYHIRVIMKGVCARIGVVGNVINSFVKIPDDAEKRLQKVLAACDRKMDDMRKVLAANCMKIAELQQKVASRDWKICKLWLDLLSREKQIHELRKEIAVREEKFRS